MPERSDTGFNVRLCQVIDSHGSNVSELSRGTGLPRVTINRWIKGERDPFTSSIRKIAEFWPDVDLHWLITGENWRMK